MLFTLEVLPAAEGDCLLLHWGEPDSPHIAAIDGGPANTYETSLKPRLDEIRQNLEVDKLNLDLVIVSHADSDHIVGIKKLFRQLKQEVEDAVPDRDRPFGVTRLWHNTFNDILGDSIDGYYRTLTASYQAGVGGAPDPRLVEDLKASWAARHGLSPCTDEMARDIALILAGHGEARDLRDYHKFLYEARLTRALNTPFREQDRPTLIVGKDFRPTSLDGLQVTILGPLGPQVEALQSEFDQYITDHGLVLAAYADDSIKNLSSIVCLVEMDGKRMLLTGDARGDTIIQALEAGGLLDDGVLEVDVLKVPHHGSSRNLEAAFFKAIVADTYVFSADGKHGNPDRDTMQWLTEARGRDAQYRIVLTYPLEHIDENRRADANKRHKPWNRQQDSLEVFFKEKADQGFRLSLTTDAPARIELGSDTIGW
jgi:hypothetical protein